MNPKNCLSFWYPRIEAAGLLVPKTVIVKTDCDLLNLLDGKMPEALENYETFLSKLGTAADSIGYPCFLRTGHTSGKQNWKRTCYLPDGESLESHVAALVEWSELSCIIGLPVDTWVVRELLPTKPLAILTAYGDMPLVREFRVFTKGGKFLCEHTYWQAAAIGNGKPDRMVDLQDLEMDFEQYCHHWELAEKAVAAVGEEDWSVDILETADGTNYITDMAIASDSWHWPGCPMNKTEKAV